LRARDKVQKEKKGEGEDGKVRIKGESSEGKK
jgi:hypothetical protein